MVLGDKYRSLYVIGRGGMGRVEVALQLKTDGDAARGSDFERIVALKRLLPEGALDKRHTEMFLREARLAVLLTHPNVVHAFDFGEADGEFFLAMEYVEGEPLSRVLSATREKAKKLEATIAAHILANICDGLHAAHELRDVSGTMLNVVHRDVSPHNVMVAYEGQIKLLDFGVAKIDAEGLTRTGEVKGKVAYMSPEQAMGDVLDRRSDLYSIGAVLFECVAGRRMWQGTDMEVLRQLALDEPPRLEDLAVDAPKELCALYTRLVARDPKVRPATAHDVAEELRAFVLDRSSTKDVKALMRGLFADDAARRKDELTRALEGAAPADAEALRQSLVPDESSALATAVVAPRPAPAPGKRGVVMMVALVIAISSVAVAASLKTPAAPPPASPSPNAVAAPTPEPRPSSAPAPSPTPPTPPAITPPTPSPSIKISRPQIPTVVPKPKASASSKPVDVDPNPI